MPFWGRRKDHEPTEPSRTQNEDEHGHPEQRFEEPTERSRLLPEDSHEGFLSPDDPAVSPTNTEKHARGKLSLTREPGIALQSMERARGARRVSRRIGNELHMVDIPACLYIRQSTDDPSARVGLLCLFIYHPGDRIPRPWTLIFRSAIQVHDNMGHCTYRSAFGRYVYYPGCATNPS